MGSYPSLQQGRIKATKKTVHGPRFTKRLSGSFGGKEGRYSILTWEDLTTVVYTVVWRNSVV